MGDARDRDEVSQNGSTGKIPPPPVAIVGMGLRLPGGVNSASSLWDLLINKRNGRCLVPASRYNVDAFYRPSKTTGSVASRYGYFLQEDMDKFDASFFSMSKAEVDRLDPQQRLLLEVVWECMESGGQRNWRGDNIGCYVGVFGDVSYKISSHNLSDRLQDWLDMGAKDAQNSGLYRISGSESLGVSNRISYEFDLKGPR
jgi:acyl transferase domain-containing protein